jgi:predicted GNAT superfamily acetyltransferase
MSRPVENVEGAHGADVLIRECTTITEFDACIRLQREVFGLPDLEVSPRRHLIVSRLAGGWILGAFAGEHLVGFVHHLAAVRADEIIGYSHRWPSPPIIKIADSARNSSGHSATAL